MGNRWAKLLSKNKVIRVPVPSYWVGISASY